MLIDLELDNDSNFGSETRAVCLGKALLGSMARVTKVVKLDGLAKVWESDFSLRQRASKGRSLMISTIPGISQVLGNVKNVAANVATLKPLVGMMSAQGIVDTPSVDMLAPVCAEFLELANYPNKDDLQTIAHQDAWGIKRCLTLCRRKWSKTETPKDSGFHLQALLYRMSYVT